MIVVTALLFLCGTVGILLWAVGVYRIASPDHDDMQAHGIMIGGVIIFIIATGLLKQLQA